MPPRRAAAAGLITLAFCLLLAPAGAGAAQVYFIEFHTTRPDGTTTSVSASSGALICTHPLF